jgi:hypothetical protein
MDIAYCHNPTNNPKQNNLVGVVLLSVKNKQKKLRHGKIRGGSVGTLCHVASRHTHLSVVVKIPQYEAGRKSRNKIAYTFQTIITFKLS